VVTVARDPECAARHAMVREQIHRRGVRDRRVLAALATVPRHEFVPPSLRHGAHDDAPLPIAHRQTISQPYMVAVMTAAIAPRRHHRVLEIGTGSGYQAAILAHLAREVYTIERLAALSADAEERLARLGYRNVAFRVGDGAEGWPEAAPYDGILVTAAAPDVPTPLLAQLAVGGRIAVPVGDLGLQVLTLVERLDTGVRRWTEGACRFVPLIGPHAFPERP
jgi:protein-L-isoaspartate(D-aspartate) O-methyltransferase